MKQQVAQVAQVAHVPHVAHVAHVALEGRVIERNAKKDNDEHVIL